MEGETVFLAEGTQRLVMRVYTGARKGLVRICRFGSSPYRELNIK